MLFILSNPMIHARISKLCYGHFTTHFALDVRSVIHSKMPFCTHLLLEMFRATIVETQNNIVRVNFFAKLCVPERTSVPDDCTRGQYLIVFIGLFLIHLFVVFQFRVRIDFREVALASMSTIPLRVIDHFGYSRFHRR